MSALPNAASASAWACCNAARKARSFTATRIPRPPPPADALISTGKPNSWASETAWASFSISPSLPGTVGTFDFLGQLAGGVFVAHQGHGLVRGTDELNVATAADIGKMRVFGQKTVARMYRLHVADLGGADDAVDLQVAVGGLGRSDAIGLVGQFQVGRAAIGLAEYRHRFDAQLAAGANNSQGNFTAIGDKYPFEHFLLSVFSGQFTVYSF